MKYLLKYSLILIVIVLAVFVTIGDEGAGLLADIAPGLFNEISDLFSFEPNIPSPDLKGVNVDNWNVLLGSFYFLLSFEAMREKSIILNMVGVLKKPSLKYRFVYPAFLVTLVVSSITSVYLCIKVLPDFFQIISWEEILRSKTSGSIHVTYKCLGWTKVFSEGGIAYLGAVILFRRNSYVNLDPQKSTDPQLE